MQTNFTKYLHKYFVSKTNKDKQKCKQKICQFGGYDHTSIDDILAYVAKKIKQEGHVTQTNINDDQEHKYCILLFGPPASGKSSSSLNFAIDLINKKRQSNLTKKNFVEIAIDGFIEDTNEWNDKRVISDNSVSLDNKTVFLKILDDINNMFKLFIYCCALFKLNFSIEMTGYDYGKSVECINIVKQLKQNFTKTNNEILKKYGYNIVCMYPYTTNVEMLIKRSEKRGKKSGRIVTANDFYKKKFIENSLFVFNNVVLQNATHFYMICKYNAEIEENKQMLHDNDILMYYLNNEPRNISIDHTMNSDNNCQNRQK